MSQRFDGFEDEMFKFFSRREKDPDDVVWIRRRMEVFGHKLLHKGLQALDSSFYRWPHVGIFHPDEDKSLWVAFGPKKLEHLLNHAHQTVSLFDLGLDVYVRVGSVAAIDSLRQALHSRRNTFSEIIAALPEPFVVQIRERTPIAPMRFPVGPPVLELAPADLRDPGSSGFAELVRVLSAIDYPHFSLRRHLDSKRVIELGSSPLLDEVLSTMTAFQPLVVSLNDDAAGV